MHLTEQTDQPKPTVFPKCWTSRNDGANVIVKYGKGGGRGGRTSLSQLEFYSDGSLLFLYIYLCFFLSLRLLGCSYPSSCPLKGQGTALIWMEYRITCLFACWRLYVQRRSFLRSFLRRRREILKAIAVGLLRCHKPK